MLLATRSTERQYMIGSIQNHFCLDFSEISQPTKHLPNLPNLAKGYQTMKNPTGYTYSKPTPKLTDRQGNDVPFANPEDVDYMDRLYIVSLAQFDSGIGVFADCVQNSQTPACCSICHMKRL